MSSSSIISLPSVYSIIDNSNADVFHAGDIAYQDENGNITNDDSSRPVGIYIEASGVEPGIHTISCNLYWEPDTNISTGTYNITWETDSNTTYSNTTYGSEEDRLRMERELIKIERKRRLILKRQIRHQLDLINNLPFEED